VHADDDCEVGIGQAQGFLRLLKSSKIDATLKTIHNFGHLAPTAIEPSATLTDIDNFLDAKLPPLAKRRASTH